MSNYMSNIKLSNIKILKSNIYILFSVLSVLYYIILSVIMKIIGFSVFWLLLAGILLFLGLVEKGKIIIPFNFINTKKFKLIFTIIIATGLLSFLIIESAIIYYGSSKSYEKSDYLLVLGAGLRGETMTLALTQRMNKALDYLREYPETKIIVSGGKGAGESITEAEAMKRFLIENGINEKNIIKEEKSTSTAENFQYSRYIIRKQQTGEDAGEAAKVTVVTTSFHMFRAKLLAERVGLKDIYTVPSELHYVLIPNSYVREYLAVIKSFIFDRVN